VNDQGSQAELVSDDYLTDDREAGDSTWPLPEVHWAREFEGDDQ